MPYVLSLDQGTTSSRAILFDEAGSIAAVAQLEFQQHYPQPGWVEHDPMEILTSQMACAVEVLGKAGARPRDVAAIGITNQRETVIVWDRATGKPIHNAIVWQDRRTAAVCNDLKQSGAEEEVSAKTGLVLDPYFSATKVAWILDHVEGARARAERGELAFGTVDSWLIWHLTSGSRHVTDVTNASRTLLYNIVKGQWDADLLKLFRIPDNMLPEVVWSSQLVGEVTTTLGLSGIPIAGIAGDQQAALFGQLCWAPGDAKNTYGTGCFLLLHTGERLLRATLAGRHSGGRHGYVVPRADGRVLVGATTEAIGFDKRVTAGAMAWLLSLALEFVPQLADARVVDQWSGLRPQSADGLPLLGPHRAVQGLIFASGHHRNGILLTPVTAEVTVNAVLGLRQRLELTAFLP